MARSLTSPVTGHSGVTQHVYRDTRIKSVSKPWNFVFSDIEGSRSDIIKRPFGRFRAPTPYSCSITENFSVRAVGQVSRDTTVWTPNYGNIKTRETMLLSGSQARSPAISESSKPSFGINSESLLIAKALATVKDQKVNVAVAIAEARQTVDLLSSALLRLAQAKRAAQSKNWKKAAQILRVGDKISKDHKSLKSGWLELQYGWKPLLSDIYGAVNILTDPKLYEGFIITGKASQKKEGSERFTRKVYFANGSTSATMACMARWQSEQKIRLDYRIDSTRLFAAMSLGLTNPALVVWEKVPFSFLVDWALPIGSVLSALDSTLGVTFLGGTLTTYHKGVQVCDSQLFSDTQFGEFPGSATGMAKRMVMSRSVYHYSPMPLPYVQNPLSMGHALNAYALLRSK